MQHTKMSASEAQHIATMTITTLEVSHACLIINENHYNYKFSLHAVIEE